MRGALACIAMFALGGIVLAGLFLAPRNRAPAAPDVAARVPPGVKLRVALWDTNGADSQLGIEALRALAPDYLLLNGVQLDEALAVAQGLGMERSFHPRAFQRIDSGPDSAEGRGVCMLSKRSLYEQRAVAGADRVAFGVWAIAVVDESKFGLAVLRVPDDSQRWVSVLAELWSKEGSPPVVIAAKGGGALEDKRSGLVLSDAVAGSESKRLPGGYSLFVSPQWFVVDRGVGSGAEGANVRWMDLGAASSRR